MNKLHYIVHTAAYYIAWFSCISLAAHGYAWLSAFVVMLCVLVQIYWQYKIQHNTRGFWFLLFLVLCISTVVDSILIANGLIIIAANPFAPYFTAPWLIAIWISFTVVLYATMKGLFNHLIILGLLSFFGFPFAYWVAGKMGAASFPYGYNTLFLIGAIWLILLPLAVYSYERRMEKK